MRTPPTAPGFHPLMPDATWLALWVEGRGLSGKNWEWIARDLLLRGGNVITVIDELEMKVQALGQWDSYMAHTFNS